MSDSMIGTEFIIWKNAAYVIGKRNAFAVKFEKVGDSIEGRFVIGGTGEDDLLVALVEAMSMVDGEEVYSIGNEDNEMEFEGEEVIG